MTGVGRVDVVPVPLPDRLPLPPEFVLLEAVHAPEKQASASAASHNNPGCPKSARLK